MNDPGGLQYAIPVYYCSATTGLRRQDRITTYSRADTTVKHKPETSNLSRNSLSLGAARNLKNSASLLGQDKKRSHPEHDFQFMSGLVPYCTCQKGDTPDMDIPHMRWKAEHQGLPLYPVPDMVP